MTLPPDYETALANFDAARALWNVNSGTDEVLDWIRDYMVKHAPAAAMEAAQARIAALEDALRPFAESDLAVTMGGSLTSTHWRIARAALAESGG